ncbi:MAG: hypothetical protein HY805_00345 [Nitrospirae bacterium]|nr:hypothetical protein [Nitrospirota bacterium]
MIKSSYKNILETGTVSLSAGTEDSNYPLYRLYDRNIGRFFKTTSAITTEIKIDQGSSPQAVDRLLIPSGHNLNGMTLDIKYSDDDITYTPAISQWTGASGLIDKSWASITKRYWKFIITTPASIPQIAELFLTQTYEWERNPSRPGEHLDPLFNIEREESFGGQVRFLIKGDPRKQRFYHVRCVGETQKNNILTLNDVWSGGKPFWFYDHEGNWLFGELKNPINIKEVSYQKYDFDFEFMEVIP